MTLSELKNELRIGVMYGFSYPTELDDLINQLSAYISFGELADLLVEYEAEGETGICRTPPPLMTVENQSRFMRSTPEWDEY